MFIAYITLRESRASLSASPCSAFGEFLLTQDCDIDVLATNRIVNTGSLWLLKTWSSKKQQADSRVIAILVRPELQTVGFAPQERSADDCDALVGDHQIPRRAEALGA